MNCLLAVVYGPSYVYGLVVANYGTAVRYRYAFVVMYVLFVCSYCKVEKLFPNKKMLFYKQ